MLRIKEEIRGNQQSMKTQIDENGGDGPISRSLHIRALCIKYTKRKHLTGRKSIFREVYKWLNSDRTISLIYSI